MIFVPYCWLCLVVFGYICGAFYEQKEMDSKAVKERNSFNESLLLFCFANEDDPDFDRIIPGSTDLSLIILLIYLPNYFEIQGICGWECWWVCPFPGFLY